GGNDTLIGGTGQDTFLFATAPGTANADVVSDFVSGTDKLTFDNSVFAALGSSSPPCKARPRSRRPISWSPVLAARTPSVAPPATTRSSARKATTLST